MKTLEMIEKEYEGYELQSTFVTDLKIFSIFIDAGIRITQKELKVIQKVMKKNHRMQQQIKMLNYFSFFSQVEWEDTYAEDNQILEEMLKAIINQKEKLERAHSIVTDKNFREVTRLVDFSCEYYNQYIDYFENRRDSLEFSCRGITYYDGKYQNNSMVFDEFFDKKLKVYQERNVKKKVK